jgi:hypothetical protein
MVRIHARQISFIKRHFRVTLLKSRLFAISSALGFYVAAFVAQSILQEKADSN